MFTKTARRVLVTDVSELVIGLLSKTLVDLGYEVQTAQSTEQAKQLVEQWKPELVYLDWQLGDHLIPTIKATAGCEQTGIIVCTQKPKFADYQAALQAGASYYLVKPFQTRLIRELTLRFFQHNLHPNPFWHTSTENKVSCYSPDFDPMQTYMRFWGTRGSIPVSGAGYNIYGGNTSCLEVRSKDTLIIIDAGTGIRALGELIMKSSCRNIHLFIGHSHWDHILGFPFFAPCYNPEFKIHVYAAKGFGRSIEELFTGMLDRDYFPVKLGEMQARFQFTDLEDFDPLIIGDIAVHYTFCNHPGATLGFKIESADRKISYITDNEFLLGYHGRPQDLAESNPLFDPYRRIMDFVKGSDVIVHEAQYNNEDYVSKVGWGHSSISNASILVKFSGAKQWIVTHHDPAHDDVYLQKKLLTHEAVCKDCKLDTSVQLAYEGMVLHL